MKHRIEEKKMQGNACLIYSLKNKELPVCCFSEDIGRTYNRTPEKFAEFVNRGKI